MSCDKIRKGKQNMHVLRGDKVEVMKHIKTRTELKRKVLIYISSAFCFK